MDGNTQGGIKVSKSGTQLTIVNCDAHNNNGPGLDLNRGPTVSVSRSTFRNNGSHGVDGGSNSNTTSSLSACIVYGNAKDGVKINQGTATLVNCLVYNNGWSGVRRS